MKNVTEAEVLEAVKKYNELAAQVATAQFWAQSFTKMLGPWSQMAAVS